ncbi:MULTISPECIES: 2Fe-2S iron-sulfur cluster-binding protein [Pseudonocardia]|uniref:Aminomethyltransferase n=2 Tax=Pseudonocardia TaxID=1847 RepID=A0A1Y2MUY0_PSEAH|nr:MULTISPECIES: 2Fe-2S iron-sulfur cluster-binding protein [Pseudonocardia]OSY38972.1 Aminomethyltransferase [Pseudonocardia autotrophica]TDN76228.1 heterotetrameric sarcosine oxidase alpha subunit [Pseudonocardia autotrophica]BBG00210.1 sarcosine oxidase subunit alpha [Pseudonocardia autotrophica]GEC26721.1 sarcosine oxidase subunit alpha [Pseudonocardia saturnea]
MSRVQGYGRVDRTRTVSFTFDGTGYTGHPGDTLASALLANGVRTVGSSIRLGRPRGIGGAWTEDPTGLVQIEEPFPEPMLQASTVELHDGLVATGVHGRGRLAAVADTARYDHRYAHCDTLVIGAGPAGLLAARTAARRGDRVVLVDDRPEAGGSLIPTERIDGRAALRFVAGVVAELAEHPEVTHLQRTTAFGHYDDGFVLALQRRPGNPAGRSRQRVHRIRAGRVVVAAGAIERPVVFADNDRPGIMPAAAARDHLHRYGVLAGREVVVFTTDDAAYDAAADLAVAGAAVTLLDARDTVPAERAAACREAGVTVRPATLVVGTDAAADGTVSAAHTDTAGTVPCDLLLVSGGWTPAAHLFSHVRGELRYDPALGAFRPAAALAGTEVVGAANGTLDLAGCLAEGAGGDAPNVPPEPARTPTAVRWRTPGESSRQFVDIARDATVADIERAVGAGMRSVEHVKRYTTIGTAHDQGRTSGMIAAGITAELLGRAAGELGTTTFRPPFVPVAFAALAGRERGALFDPVRTTAVHPWHVARGAVFEDVGQWKRARHYPHPGEDMDTAVLRECAAVRRDVGIMDGSTLGKIDVQGPDAGEFLDRVYTNLMSTLKVGRVRYGVMCGNDGMVVDDGTVLRIDEQRYLLTTTTGGAAAVLETLEDWLQTEWPQLRVHLASVTEHWSVFPVVGPRSRELIGEVFADLDVSSDAFGFMTWQDTTLDGVPVRLARISFSGELAYEVNVDSRYGLAVWERLIAAGASRGLAPYGTETMHVLRAEKGYPIIGQDTDGTVSPHDLGMSWVVSKKKQDFIGKRSFTRAENLDPLRKQLVGLLPTDASTRLPEGSQIVEFAADGALPPPPVPMLGHVTSSYHSAELARPFALALVQGGRDRIGDVVGVPYRGALVPVEITGSVLVDPEGTRRDG